MISKLKEKIGPDLKENEPLAPYVTFKIGGPAKYFYIAKTSDDLVKALKAADELEIEFFILGSGSNLIISDKGFDGLVIKPENNHFKIDGTKVHAESGALVEDVLTASLEVGLIGWNWAAGLPGTIGGAVRGNAGAYGKGMSDIVTAVELFFDGKVAKLTNEEMQFSYRHSIVKDKPAIIISVDMELQEGDTAEDLKQVEAYIDRRHKTQPLEYPNSGCVFKNIDLKLQPVDEEKIKKVLDVTDEEYKEVTKYNKLPVSFITDKMGLKGKTIGGAQLSEKHGAFVVNIGDATADDVAMLISDVKMRVRDELGIQLEEEIQYVGF